MVQAHLGLLPSSMQSEIALIGPTRQFSLLGTTGVAGTNHVPPPKVLEDCAQWGCGYVYGFRVPLIVVSPYAKAGYISHVTHDFGSILHYIEQNFGLGSLGYADAYADDLSDCFDYKQTPLTFHTISAPFDAAYFLNDKSPATDPDDH